MYIFMISSMFHVMLEELFLNLKYFHREGKQDVFLFKVLLFLFF